MASKPRILVICGTRPDAIKAAPVVLELRKFDAAETILVSTGQHREMLRQSLETFGLKADIDLAIMTHGQSLAEVTCKALEGLDELIDRYRPAWVLAQGDTTTTFTASLAAFYRQIPFGHIEAGLRTDSITDPFPEEFNRRTTAQLAGLHFAPTAWSAANLRKERHTAENIYITGNTGIDALHLVAGTEGKEWYPEHKGPIFLLTTHRRENWGAKQRSIAIGFRQVLDKYPDVLGVVAMHKNPVVRELLRNELGDHPRCELIEPPIYEDFVRLMRRTKIIFTDSGGVQEEAPSFGVPVLILRDNTERPEGVEAGCARLIGTQAENILAEATRLMENETAFAGMSNAASPYGDGKAGARIRWILLNRMGIDSPREEMWH